MLPGRTMITTDASLEAIKKEAYQQGREDALKVMNDIYNIGCDDVSPEICKKYDGCAACLIGRYEEKLKKEVES